jgi:hypothetical protein
MYIYSVITTYYPISSRDGFPDALFCPLHSISSVAFSSLAIFSISFKKAVYCYVDIISLTKGYGDPSIESSTSLLADWLSVSAI